MSDSSTTILVPIDFSDCAMEVVRQASKQAAESNARVVLLHVIRIPDGLNDDTPIQVDGSRTVTALEHLRTEAERLMPDYVAEARKRDVQVDSRIEVGDPVENIVAAAAGPSVERVVMGTHGRKGLSKIMLGSVADKVTARAKVPVETIRTVYKEHCKAGSCAWCATHHSPALLRLHAEQDG